MENTKQTGIIAKKPDPALAHLPERMDIRIDWAFKHFFGQKKHLIKIIKDLLDIDMQVIEYLPNGLDVATEQDKKSVFDVICRNTRTGEIFVLEMQTTYESDMMDRLYYYGGSLIHNQITSGDKKYHINSVLVCCIASYKVEHKEVPPEGKVFFHYKMMEKETREVFDGDKLNICFLELRRFGNLLDKGADLKKQWCWIFNNLANFAERPDNLDSSFDDIISDAGTEKLSHKQKLKYMEALHLNERERTVVYEGGYIVGKNDGLEEGRAQGAESERKRIIEVLRAAGVKEEIIEKATEAKI